MNLARADPKLCPRRMQPFGREGKKPWQASQDSESFRAGGMPFEMALFLSSHGHASRFRLRVHTFPKLFHRGESLKEGPTLKAIPEPPSTFHREEMFVSLQRFLPRRREHPAPRAREDRGVGRGRWSEATRRRPGRTCFGGTHQSWTFSTRWDIAPSLERGTFSRR